MCGITGWASFHGDARTQAPVIEAMTGTLAPAARREAASGSPRTPRSATAAWPSSTWPAGASR